MLPYDRDEPTISLEQFGTLAIYAPSTVQHSDNVFLMVRSRKRLTKLDQGKYILFGSGSSALETLSNYVGAFVLVAVTEDFHVYPRSL
jgi:hypothetical protein